jgi:hypothetical protein
VTSRWANAVPQPLRAPRFEGPAVDVRLEGWLFLARTIGAEPYRFIGKGWTSDDQPHSARCDCVDCLGRLGVGPVGVSP